MGQQIESETGVSVSVPLTFDNLGQIINLFDIPNLRVYVSGYGENSDEVRDFIYEEDDLGINYDVLDELSQCANEEEYNKKYDEMKQKADEIEETRSLESQRLNVHSVHEPTLRSLIFL